MTDKTNIEARIKKIKLEKVANTPREDEFKLQIEKIDELIAHLKEELDE